MSDDPFRAPMHESSKKRAPLPVGIVLLFVAAILWFAGGVVGELTHAPVWIEDSLAGAGTVVFCVAIGRLVLFERRPRKGITDE